MIVRLAAALWCTLPTALAMTDIAGTQAWQDPSSLDGRVCTSWSEFQAKIESLRAEAEGIEPKLLAAITKIVAGGEKESTSIAELSLVLEEVSKKLLVCKSEREQALKDIELYRAELAELTEIATADAQSYDWTAISLLGTRAESHLELEQSERVHRAAEMHVSLASTAKKVAACKKQTAQTTPDTWTNTSGLGTFNLSNFTTTWNMSTTTFNMSTECQRQQEVLVRLYKIAYVHISGLLQTSLIIAQDDVCTLTVYQMFQERRLTIDTTIYEARKEICTGISIRAEAQALALQMKSRFEATFSDFNGQCAAASYTQFFQGLLELVTLSQASLTIGDSSFCSSLTQPTSLLQEDVLIHAPERQTIEAHKQNMTGAAIG